MDQALCVKTGALQAGHGPHRLPALSKEQHQLNNAALRGRPPGSIKNQKAADWFPAYLLVKLQKLLDLLIGQPAV